MIGVAISTRNRRELALESIGRWRERLPPGAVLVIVDDASDEPLPDIDDAAVIRHDYQSGVAMTKNRCIAELVDAGCEHLFLSDDDVYPTTDDWWRPYVDSPEPHLMYGWEGSHQRHTNRNWPPRITHADGQHTAYSFPRGVMLYLHRRIVDTVGGMNTAHGIFSGEHVEYSGRIHAAGLTTWPFADITGSEHVWYAHDREVGNITGSSFPLKERRRLHQANGIHWDRRWPGWPWFGYREREGVQDYQIGPRLGNSDRDVLTHVLGCHPGGVGVEFGVGSGETLRLIAAKMPAIGFDSFQGLPEDWRPEYPAGALRYDRPDVPGATIIDGLFADSLPGFYWPEHIGLVHIDCDLYSSTATALKHIGPHLLPGCYIVFDEWFGYDGCEHHEQRAWREYAERTGTTWTVVGSGREQWAIRLT